MNTNITNVELIDFLGVELTPQRQGFIATQLKTDPALRRQLEELQLLRTDVQTAPDVTPGSRADDRFAAMLAQAMEEPQLPRKVVRRLPLYRILAVAASLLLVFSLGWHFGQGRQNTDRQELAANRALMLELMNGQKTSSRIRATTVAMNAPSADPELTENLGYLLHNDPNANVCLAAIKALKRFPNDPLVHRVLLAAMESNLQEVVRLQLLETLVQLRIKEAAPYLEELIQNDTLPQHLRDAARMGTFKLL
jgi:hypothetical protein